MDAREILGRATNVGDARAIEMKVALQVRLVVLRPLRRADLDAWADSKISSGAKLTALSALTEKGDLA